MKGITFWEDKTVFKLFLVLVIGYAAIIGIQSGLSMTGYATKTFCGYAKTYCPEFNKCLYTCDKKPLTTCGSYGDVDGDGWISSNDAQTIYSAALNQLNPPLDQGQIEIADVSDKPGRASTSADINIVDYYTVLQYVLGKRNTFPVCGGATIQIYVFNDINKNGIPNFGERLQGSTQFSSNIATITENGPTTTDITPKLSTSAAAYNQAIKENTQYTYTITPAPGWQLTKHSTKTPQVGCIKILTNYVCDYQGQSTIPFNLIEGYTTTLYIGLTRTTTYTLNSVAGGGGSATQQFQSSSTKCTNEAPQCQDDKNVRWCYLGNWKNLECLGDNNFCVKTASGAAQCQIKQVSLQSCGPYGSCSNSPGQVSKKCLTSSLLLYCDGSCWKQLLACPDGKTCITVDKVPNCYDRCGNGVLDSGEVCDHSKGWNSDEGPYPTNPSGGYFRYEFCSGLFLTEIYFCKRDCSGYTPVSVETNSFVGMCSDRCVSNTLESECNRKHPTDSCGTNKVCDSQCECVDIPTNPIQSCVQKYGEGSVCMGKSSCTSTPHDVTDTNCKGDGDETCCGGTPPTPVPPSTCTPGTICPSKCPSAHPYYCPDNNGIDNVLGDCWDSLCPGNTCPARDNQGNTVCPSTPPTQPAPTATILGRVWKDDNENGRQDGSEQLISDESWSACKRFIISPSVSIVGSQASSFTEYVTKCNPDPYYQKDGLPEGDYNLKITYPQGWKVTGTVQSGTTWNANSDGSITGKLMSGEEKHIWFGLAQVNNEPIGAFDSADCSKIAGWTCDLDSASFERLDVAIYKDNPKESNGVLVGQIFKASVLREAAVGSACKGDTV
ncbi:MAG: hypothetical protein AABX51_09245, partial [Nanoarchaeota archaeon]